MTENMVITSHSRVLALATFCFDISVVEIFLPLINGGTMILANSNTSKDPYQLIKLVNTMNVTLLQATQTCIEMMMIAGWKGNPQVDCVVGGEAFRPNILSIIRNLKSCWNAYGPTECSIAASFFQVTPEFVDSLLANSERKFVVPIGIPISSTDFYLLDPATEELITEPETEGVRISSLIFTNMILLTFLLFTLVHRNYGLAE